MTMPGWVASLGGWLVVLLGLAGAAACVAAAWSFALNKVGRVFRLNRAFIDFLAERLDQRRWGTGRQCGPGDLWFGVLLGFCIGTVLVRTMEALIRWGAK